MTEHDLADAKQRLQIATNEIQKQNEALRAQKRGLEDLKKWQRGNAENEVTNRRKRRDGWIKEKRLLGLAVSISSALLFESLLNLYT